MYAYQEENLVADKSKRLNQFLMMAIEGTVNCSVSAILIWFLRLGSVFDMRIGDA